jgi:3D (Asp-Asp-Asp) domain-containing protein
MRYLIVCLAALGLLSSVAAQDVEFDGTLLSPSLGLPQGLLNLPLMGHPVQAQTKPAPKPAPKPVAKPTQTQTKKPAPAKPAATAKKPVAKPAPKPAAARVGPSYVLKSTAYNSHVSQTDRTPFITATGARTRFGVIALSRDMLRTIPYGSLVRIEDLGNWGSGRGRGKYNRMLSGVTFQVEDTMHPRKVRTVDVWFYSRSQALQWGARQVKITVLRRGR